MVLFFAEKKRKIFKNQFSETGKSLKVLDRFQSLSCGNGSTTFKFTLCCVLRLENCAISFRHEERQKDCLQVRRNCKKIWILSKKKAKPFFFFCKKIQKKNLHSQKKRIQWQGKTLNHLCRTALPPSKALTKAHQMLFALGAPQGSRDNAQRSL